ncbi:hypothetical protein J7T55_000112 [Diaporthe amygdali]|uniref:uncharacterized protein n=1 Tax=Phomopsis amygdali TaxID=1214568 RepID=UPI0022FF37E2|nr:uncharacterized protein J7T55_000112 [Diaporthe amygdali]KAJ0100745.1 hypothetical protein J7T55_000112 [Diaporthe amygdali]
MTASNFTAKAPGQAQNFLPCAMLEAAAAGTKKITIAQRTHAQIWTTYFKSDVWFEAARAVQADPVLIAQSFEKASYVVLASLDWTGDLKYRLPSGTTILDYLHPGTYKDGEYTLNNGAIINIWEAMEGSDYSKVRNLDEQLARGREDAQWQTSMVYLNTPAIHTLVCKKPEQKSRRMIVRTNHPNPYGGGPVDWLLVDGKYQPGFRQKKVDMVESEFKEQK